MDMPTIMMIVWVSIFVLSIIFEALTTAFVSIWFSVGAISALAVTYIPGMPWWGDLLVFIGVSALALIGIKPVVDRLLARNKTSSNIDSIIGKRGRVTKHIDSLNGGEVKISGITWTALPVNDIEEVEEGKVVVVVAISGNKLFVKEEKK